MADKPALLSLEEIERLEQETFLCAQCEDTVDVAPNTMSRLLRAARERDELEAMLLDRLSERAEFMKERDALQAEVEALKPLAEIAVCPNCGGRAPMERNGGKCDYFFHKALADLEAKRG